MWEVLRFEPCSPTCPNWLRYGVQPKKAKPGQRAGYCRRKVHRRDARLRRSPGARLRRWSGKTLSEHRRDRRTWVRDILGLPDDPDPRRYVWMVAGPQDDDVAPRSRRLLLAVADRARWRDELARAQAAATGQADRVAA